MVLFLASFFSLSLFSFPGVPEFFLYVIFWILCFCVAVTNQFHTPLVFLFSHCIGVGFFLFCFRISVFFSLSLSLALFFSQSLFSLIPRKREKNPVSQRMVKKSVCLCFWRHLCKFMWRGNMLEDETRVIIYFFQAFAEY